MQLPASLDDMRRLVEAETGMDLGGERAGRLRDAVIRTQGGAAGRLPLDWLERLTAQLTVGETYFFRNECHFAALRNHVLPEIIRANAGKRQVRIWSAGCATGEEPYSVAIVLDQLLGIAPGWHVSILATDINHSFLERAREGLYRQWSFRQTDIHKDGRYFTPEGEMHRLSAAIRGRVHFAYLNLVKDVYPSPLTGTLGLDLIIFRNVAIYLKPEVTRAIIERFRRALRPGGWLLLSETELNIAPGDAFESQVFDQATFFRKRATGAAELDVPVSMPILPLPSLTEPQALPAWSPLPQRKSAVVQPPTWERIQQSLSRCDFAEAERSIDQVADNRERARLRLRYAKALLACAEQQRSQQSLDLCLREDPLLLEAHLLKASFAEEADNWQAAEKAYRQALYIDRKCPMAHFHLALVQRQRGDRAGASRSLKTTMKLIEHQDPQAVVEYGEGICFGRLKEIVVSLANPW